MTALEQLEGDIEKTSVDATSPIGEEEDLQKAGEQVYVAPPWKLMWWRFRKHRMALICTGLLFVLYFVALFCEFVAPYDPDQAMLQYKQVPPTRVHIRDTQGEVHWPFVYQHTRAVDPETFRITYIEDTSIRWPVYLFVHGYEYKLLGLWPTDIHLFGLEPAAEGLQGIFLFGTDRLGRDMFARVCYGARLSLSMGLISVFLSLALGVVLGGISGYYGGRIDTVIQRVIEFVRTIPTIPLYMTLSAALPRDWPIERVYFGITLILAIVGWTWMARVVRGRFLTMREEDFVLAARLNGAREMRIILRHMLPSFLSYIIAVLTLSIPNMILAETGLSFIGLGLRPPAISWGVLLQEAMNLRSLVLAPWVLVPGLAVVISVVSFNFVGDGLRDAADPYAR
jgi:peptide/nickel transport system permease protein